MEVIASDMSKLLYPEGRWAPGGPLAEAIVRLAVFWKSLENDVAILTTNYDSNLEDFAGDAELQELAGSHGIVLEPFVEPDRIRKPVIPVYHFNGYIPFDGRATGNLAFSETGLELGTEVVGSETPKLDWRGDLLEKRLRSSTTVFVGTSLRDPTVIGALIKTRDARHEWPRYGIFPYQGDAWADADRDVRSFADQALRARLNHLGVEPVRPDFFGQVAQLLGEVVHCCFICGGQYVTPADPSQRYGGRLCNWWECWKRAVGHHRAPNQYHDKCQELLADAKSAVARRLSPGRSELLKLEIWLRLEPAKRRELQLWATSEAAGRVTRGHHTSPIENRSDYAAVRALCQGFAVRGPVPTQSRWQSYFSVPIVLNEEPWYKLPVGVVNLMSTRRETDSCLRRLGDPTTFADVAEELRGVGVAILDPASEAWRLMATCRTVDGASSQR